MSAATLQKPDVRATLEAYEKAGQRRPGLHQILLDIGQRQGRAGRTGSIPRLKRLLAELDNETLGEYLPTSDRPIPDPITGLVTQLWAQLENEFDALQAVLDAERDAELAEKDQALSLANDTIASLEATLKAHEETLAECESALQARTDTLAEQQTAMGDLDQTLAETQRKLDSTNERNQTLHQALADSTAKEQALQHTLTEQSKQFLAQIKDLTANQTAAEAAHHKTREDVMHFRDAHLEAQRRITALEPALAQAQTANDSLSADHQTLKEALATTQGNKEALLAENTRLLNTQECLQTDLTTATTEISACTAMGEENARLETRYQKLLDQLKPTQRSD
ncbi:MAG TPA: hypothetical protein ENI62_10345 [Gammaproteobacteria bacterium]|nr:hypothetical protein [Gammaproteobacteria bacterium]